MHASRISPALILGDAVVLLAFSAGGIAFHQTPGAWQAELARIGLPFAVGYYLAAYSVGALSVAPTGRQFATRTLTAWLTGIGLGILFRVAAEGRVPIPIFIAVTYLFTGALLLLWRLVWWLVRSRRARGTRN